MQPDQKFVNLSKEFWSNIRTISQAVGYTERPKRAKGVKGQIGAIKIPTIDEVANAFAKLHLSTTHLFTRNGGSTTLGKTVFEYFHRRAELLNRIVEPMLQTAQEAKLLYESLISKRASLIAVPMNKQSGTKKSPAYLTAMVNILIESNLGGLPCNYNPQELTTVTYQNAPFRTLARRIDGAFPEPVDPIAIWEIKEYYYTTTFGSRVADGVYETLLDGMELEELNEAILSRSTPSGHSPIRHLLIVDAHFTWWVKGRSYLCRIIDMLHMGYLDEVLFGREIVTRLPAIVKEWVKEYKVRKKSKN